MAENPQTTATTTPRQGPTGLEALAVHRQPIGFALLALSALILVIPLLQWIMWWKGLWPVVWWPVLIWSILLVLVTLGTAVWYLASFPEEGFSAADQLRVLILIVTGAVGLFTAMLGLALALTEPYSAVFARGLQAWRENPRALIVCGLALFGGLGLMFAGMQAARVFERTRSNMRRLLYGYNTVLSALLLLTVIVLINVLAYVQIGPLKFFSTPFDWTGEQIHTLSPSTRNFLAELKQPVKVIVLLRGSSAQMAETLLENCRAVTPQITWQSLSRDLNQDDLQRLVVKYQIPGDDGLLVLYGEEGKVAHQFIDEADLIKDEPSEGPEDRAERTRKHIFLGESALVNALTRLSEGKVRAKVYFTQGNGEMPLRQPGGRAGTDSLEWLTTRLARENFETAELAFGPELKKVPDDADVVVVAGPRQELPPEAVSMLRDYVKGAEGKKGKLVVMLDVEVRRDGGMVQTGLEGLLAEANVKVNNDRVIALRPAQDQLPWPPTALFGLINSDARGPIARAFTTEEGTLPFRFDNARSLSVLPSNAPGGSSVEELIQVRPQMGVWGETDLAANPSALAADLRKPENEKRLAEKLSRKPVTLGVTVSDFRGGAPPGRGHESLAEPRMVVFGTSTWISNRTLLRSQFGENNYNLFASCLSWLRGRADLGTKPINIEKSRREYRLTMEGKSFVGLNLLPPVLMTVAVLGLGVGIWVVRRR
jgi:hypothetical protein